MKRFAITPQEFKEADEEALFRVVLPESDPGELNALHNVPTPGSAPERLTSGVRSCDSVVRRVGQVTQVEFELNMGYEFTA